MLLGAVKTLDYMCIILGLLRTINVISVKNITFFLCCDQTNVSLVMLPSCAPQLPGLELVLIVQVHASAVVSSNELLAMTLVVLFAAED